MQKLQKLEHLERIFSVIGVIAALVVGLFFLPFSFALVICCHVVALIVYIFLPWKSGGEDGKEKFGGLIRFSHAGIRTIFGLVIVACLGCGLAAKLLPKAADDYFVHGVAEIQKDNTLTNQLVQVKITSTNVTTTLTNSVIGVGSGQTAMILPVPPAVEFFLKPVASLVVNLAWVAALVIFVCVWVLLLVEFLATREQKSTA